MFIRNLACTTGCGRRILSASVVWEDQEFPTQQLIFEIGEPQGEGGSTVQTADAESLLFDDDLGPDAFLAACFPLAAVHGEARVKIEGQPCPMLVEGLHTAHAWWTSWGGMPGPAPEVEVQGGRRSEISAAPRRAVAFLSGGVDSLHVLMHNRKLYCPDDPAYIRDALFIHGFDIGKRARDPEKGRYRAALQQLEKLAAEAGVRVIPCRTNLRHLPTHPGFFELRHCGAFLAAVGHAATPGAAFVFIGGSSSLYYPIPWGSHPAVDGLFSSQRVTVIHDGSRFSRFEKVREIAGWPAALAALRVCPGKPSHLEANCGECEKCLRTRLELLAAGVAATEALGPSLTPIELWHDIAPADVGERGFFYEELLPTLRSGGFDDLCRVIEGKLAIYQRHEQPRLAAA
jgi:hypothetical protein